MTWKHNIETTRRRGKVMSRCVPCGKQSPWGTPEDALMWAARHADLKEKERAHT